MQASTSGGSWDCSSPSSPGDLQLGTQASTNLGSPVLAPTGSERLSLGLELCRHLWPGARTHRSPILRKPICKPAVGREGEIRWRHQEGHGCKPKPLNKSNLQTPDAAVPDPRATPGQHGVTRPFWPRALPGQDKVGLCSGKLPEVGRPNAPVPHFPPVLQPVSVLPRVCGPLPATSNSHVQAL